MRSSPPAPAPTLPRTIVRRFRALQPWPLILPFRQTPRKGLRLLSLGPRKNQTTASMNKLQRFTLAARYRLPFRPTLRIPHAGGELRRPAFSSRAAAYHVMHCLVLSFIKAYSSPFKGHREPL